MFSGTAPEGSQPKYSGSPQRDKGVVGVPVHLGQISTPGEGGRPRSRDVRMLGEKHAVEPTFFDGSGEFNRLDGVIRRKHGDAELGVV